MKYLAFISIIFIMSGVVLAQGIGDTQYDYKKGEIITGFNDNVSYDEAIELLNVYSLNYTNSSWDDKVLIVIVPRGKEQQWIKELSEQSIVKYAELNYLAVVVSENSDYNEFQEVENEFKTPEIAADHWMYGFKRFGESVTSLFTFGDSKRTALNYKLLKERLSELNDLAQRDKDVTFFIEDVRSQIEDTNSSFKFSDSESIRNSSDFFRESSLVLQLVYQKVPDKAKIAIQNALNKTLEIKSQQDVKLGIYDDFTQALRKENENSIKVRDDARKYYSRKNITN
ncbi:MAG: hypothetical protein HY831_02165 [Candidatus Aenigmarchaeota archaeon]|nr:hypothetical protein [Candidatus Aenigmarchaeota archaeon]